MLRGYYGKIERLVHLWLCRTFCNSALRLAHPWDVRNPRTHWIACVQSQSCTRDWAHFRDSRWDLCSMVVDQSPRWAPDSWGCDCSTSHDIGMNSMPKKGWFRNSARHALARLGIKTKPTKAIQRSKITFVLMQTENKWKYRCASCNTQYKHRPKGGCKFCHSVDIRPM